jgi:hypothetical protein
MLQLDAGLCFSLAVRPPPACRTSPFICRHRACLCLTGSQALTGLSNRPATCSSCAAGSARYAAATNLYAAVLAISCAASSPASA